MKRLKLFAKNNKELALYRWFLDIRLTISAGITEVRSMQEIYE